MIALVNTLDILTDVLSKSLSHPHPTLPIHQSFPYQVLLTTNHIKVNRPDTVITIPIIILRRARIQLKQKIALGIFLCLSVVMIGLALTRMSKIILPTVGSGAAVDNWWQFFWQFIEASVAVLMASLTAVRNLFVATSGRRSDNKGGGGNRPRSDPVSFRMRLRMRHRRLDSSEGSTNEKEGWEGDNLKLPRIPRATITGLRSYIDREGN